MADFPIGGYTFVETIGADTTGSKGTSVVTGGASTKGSWTELSSATSAASDFAILCIVFQPLSGSNIRDFLFDLAVGAASSETVFVSDIQIQMKEQFTPVSYYYLPINIGSGSRVSIRAASNAATQTAIASMALFKSEFSGSPGLAGSTAYGISGEDGTAVDAGGTANTKGSWTEITAATSGEIKSFNLCISQNSNTAHTAAHFLADIGIGGSGSEQTILENLHIVAGSFEISKVPIFLKQKIPSGTRIAIRIQSSITDATDRILSFSINGIN